MRSTWSGRRNLIEADNKYSASMNVTDARDSMQSYEFLLSTLPSWCLFEGMIGLSIILNTVMDKMDCMIILFRSTVLSHGVYSNNYIRSASQLYLHSRIYTGLSSQSILIIFPVHLSCILIHTLTQRDRHTETDRQTYLHNA